MKFILLSMLLITFSCASKKMVEKKGLTSEQLAKKKMSCMLQGHGADCAIYAYQIEKSNPAESMKFYELGCKAGDKTSCYNSESLNRSAFEYNRNIVTGQQNEVFSCYINYTTDKKKEGWFESNKKETELTLYVEIKKDGKLENVRAQTNSISPEGQRCIKLVFSKFDFRPSKNGVILKQRLVLPAAFKAKPKKKGNAVQEAAKTILQ